MAVWPCSRQTTDWVKKTFLCGRTGLPTSLIQLVPALLRACPALAPPVQAASRSERLPQGEMPSSRAERSSGVMFLADALPPCRPNMRSISIIAARTSGGIFIPSMVHLTGYGERGG
jgi:hypothetical protein